MENDKIALDNASKNKNNTGVLHKINRGLYFGIKRIFDLLCALVGSLLLLPVAIVTKIAYLISGDKKSILYTQK